MTCKCDFLPIFISKMKDTKKTVIDNELHKLITSLESCIPRMNKYSATFDNFQTAMQNLVFSDMPEFSSCFVRICEIYGYISEVYNSFANKFNRALEDLRDINCRFAVLVRVRAERNEAYTQFLKDFKNAHFAKLHYKPTDSFYIEMIKNEKDSAQQLYNLDKLLYETQRKFRKFQRRRIQSALLRFSRALMELGTYEASVYSNLADMYKTLSEHPANGELCLQSCDTEFIYQETLIILKQSMDLYNFNQTKKSEQSSIQPVLPVSKSQTNLILEETPKNENEPINLLADPNADIEEFVAVKKTNRRTVKLVQRAQSQQIINTIDSPMESN